MRIFITLFLVCSICTLIAQPYTRQDSLRGSITPERAWWDLKKYDLYTSVDPDSRKIEGYNKITYEVLEAHLSMQLDLQPPMHITKVIQDETELDFKREGNAFFIQPAERQVIGEEKEITIYFEGIPKEAKMPPWDGGFSWKRDSNGQHFIATSNQGIGASIWWPCKDHMYDEPDNGMTLAINVPQDLVAVGNGRLIETKKSKGSRKTYKWEVVNPINNYGVNINIGDYVNISSKYEGLKGTLDVDFYVLKENEEKARVQFEEAYRTLEAFEHWFGPYPFYEDSYKLVEVPYLGMEHQSSVTYGNNYRNGYNGRGRIEFDWSGTGWGKKFDYIIIHETGHEWFANNITAKDNADLWIHESFTTYSESLFLEYFFGKEAAYEYIRGQRRNIQNRVSLTGDYGVNKSGGRGIYWKGCNMLHTIRQILDDDEKWRTILVGLNKEFYHQTVTNLQVEGYINESSEVDLSRVFDQYLRDTRIPVFEYIIEEGGMQYRWSNCIEGFKMPFRVSINGKDRLLNPTTSFQTIVDNVEKLEFNPDYYVYSFQIK